MLRQVFPQHNEHTRPLLHIPTDKVENYKNPLHKAQLPRSHDYVWCISSILSGSTHKYLLQRLFYVDDDILELADIPQTATTDRFYGCLSAACIQ